MSKVISLLFIFLFSAITSNYAEKSKIEDIRVRVLTLNNVGKEYKFNTEDSAITYLKLLGTIHDKNGKNYKILTSIWIWGLSHRATSRILVYTTKNKYIGNYYLTMTDDLPDYIKSNRLVFLNKGHDCDTQLITYLDFNNGIPKEFFRKCKDNHGDIYTFSKN